MADDKIVTKKTAAKKAVSKKAAAKKTTVGESEAKTPSASTSRPAAKKVASKKAPASSSSMAAKAPKRPATPTSPPPAPAGSSAAPARQGSLRQLANVSPEKRMEMIKEAAYYRAEKRNFEPGHDAEDWAMAEREIDELISRARQMTGG